MCVDLVNNGWSLFYWGLMLLWVMNVRFEHLCTVSEKLQGYFQVYRNSFITLRTPKLVVERSVVAMAASS